MREFLVFYAALFIIAQLDTHSAQAAGSTPAIKDIAEARKNRTFRKKYRGKPFSATGTYKGLRRTIYSLTRFRYFVLFDVEGYLVTCIFSRKLKPEYLKFKTGLKFHIKGKLYWMQYHKKELQLYKNCDVAPVKGE